MAGCENVAETRKEGEKSMERILGKETATSDDKKSDEQESKGGRREKDKEKD
jgi:hypothetical protein